MAKKQGKRRSAKTGKVSKKRGGGRDKRSREGAAPDHPPAAADDLLTMEQAIAMVKTTRPTFYRWLRTGKVKGMKVGRQWRFTREELQRLLKGEAPVIDAPVSVEPLVEQISRRYVEAAGKAMSLQGNGVSRAASSIFVLASVSRASDIHIAPHAARADGPGTARVRLRIDGVLHTVAEFDLRLLPALIARFKVICACDVHEQDRIQYGRCMCSVDGRAMDFRLCFMPAHWGESVAIRLLIRDVMLPNLDQLPLAEADRQKYREAIGRPNGIILVCGPAGCGKTTTMYAGLQKVDREQLKVMTVEDPVECSFAGMVQTQVNAQAGITCASALRSIHRSDPDVVMVGELRDPEVVQIVLQMALTGHLIFSQLHTNDAASTLTRLLDLHADAFLTGETLRLVISQRLVRQLCEQCRRRVELNAEQAEHARDLVKAGGIDWDSMDKRFHKSMGCTHCAQTGYRGRTLVTEAMVMTVELAAALRRGAAVEELRTIAVGQGMTTMAADGVRRAAAGETTLDEVIRVMPKM